MHLNHAIVLNTEKPNDGQYSISGWIDCPTDCRVILRFITMGDADNKVEGLHWSAKGGWYKYLPATGNREFFEINATFDLPTHGTPEVRIERWYGTGHIDLLLQQFNLEPLTLFWGSDESFKAFKRSTFGLVEHFPLASCFIAAAEPMNEELSARVADSKDASKKSLELQIDIDKQAFERLGSMNFDALVVDIGSLAIPIVDVGGSHIEVTRDARAIGAVPLESVTIEPGDMDYLAIFKRSLQALIRIVRPRPCVIQIINSSRESEIVSTTSTAEAVKRMISDLEPETIGYRILELEDSEGVTDDFNRLMLKDYLEPIGYSFDEHMIEIPKANHATLLNSFVPIEDLSVVQHLDLPSKFELELDILASKKHTQRSLLLSLQLKGINGEEVSENLSKFGISRSKMQGINYFKYLPVVQGSKTIKLEVELPRHIRCVGFSIEKIRDAGPVFISRIQIQSDAVIQFDTIVGPSPREEVML